MQVRLPSNPAAEQQVLGALLIKDSLIFDLAEEVAADDFVDPGHAQIYRTIEALVFKGKRVNATLVRDYLGSVDSGAKVDEAYLDALTAAVAGFGDVPHYARQVADLARRRRLILAMVEGVGELGQLDPNVPSQSIIDRIETDVLGATRIDASSLKPLGDWARKSIARVIDAVERPSTDTKGLSWGITAVDNVTGPLMPGNLVILGGRPGAGKSALSAQAAEHFGGQAPGYIQSLEMQGDEIAERLMAQYCDIAAWRINVAKLNEAEIERLQDAADRLRRLPVWIDHRPRLSIDQIRARAIRYKHKFGIKWMVLDHLHICRPSRGKMDKYEAVDEVCVELKQIAKDLRIGVVALAQLNKEIRGRDDGRPRAGDLLYYSAIEPHADSIIFTHRPEIAMAERKPDSSDPDDRKYADWKSRFDMVQGKAEIINAKRRSGKSYQTQECAFIAPIMRFQDLQEKPRLLAADELAGF